MTGKISILVLDVDLQCSRCYRKVKKTLAKFPEIQAQIFDEKKNTVRISGPFCCPEKFAKKLCCKAGKSIKSIVILEEEKPKPKPDPPPPKPADPPPQKPADPPPPPPKKPEPAPKPPEPKPKEPEPKPKEPERVLVCFPVPACPPGYSPGYPVGTCCGPCSEGRGGGPCYEGYGRPLPGYDGGYGRPLPSYDGDYGRPLPCHCGCGGRGGQGSCGDYFTEENPSCIIM